MEVKRQWDQQLCWNLVAPSRCHCARYSFAATSVCSREKHRRETDCVGLRPSHVSPCHVTMVCTSVGRTCPCAWRRASKRLRQAMPHLPSAVARACPCSEASVLRGDLRTRPCHRRPTHTVSPTGPLPKKNPKRVQERQRLCRTTTHGVRSLAADAFGAHVTRQTLTSKQTNTKRRCGSRILRLHHRVLQKFNHDDGRFST